MKLLIGILAAGIVGVIVYMLTKQAGASQFVERLLPREQGGGTRGSTGTKVETLIRDAMSGLDLYKQGKALWDSTKKSMTK